MYFKQILDERCGCASYLIASRQSREAAIIDPAIDTHQYETLLAERNFQVRYVIDTHVHADHVSGARAIRAAFGAELCLHESVQATYPFRALRDGEELELGQLRVRVLHTPGHRAELISILTDGVPARPLNMTAIEATNRGLADMPWAMLTTLPKVPEVEIEALERRSRDALLIDVREPGEYAHGHIAGAINLPQADLASRLDEVPRDRSVLLLCERGVRSFRTAQFLIQVGVDRVASGRGGTAAWRAAGKPLALGDTRIEKSHVAESAWAHAGGAGS